MSPPSVSISAMTVSVLTLMRPAAWPARAVPGVGTLSAGFAVPEIAGTCAVGAGTCAVGDGTLDGVDAAGAGCGRVSFCHASHRSRSEKENTKNNMRRCVSITPVEAPSRMRPVSSGARQSAFACVGHRIAAPRMPRMAARDALQREPGALQRAMHFERFQRIRRAGRMKPAGRAEHRADGVAIRSNENSEQAFQGSLVST